MKNEGMVTAFLVAGFTFLCAISSTVGNDREKNDPVKLNVGAFEYAKELIEQGYSIADGKGAWREHQPLAEKENDSSGFTGLVNMQNGISELTIGTLRIRTEDTNFPVAISKMLIVVAFSPRKLELGNMATLKSKARQ